MKEHPLLLSTEMVLAFLADRKQVTRRIPGPTNSLVNGKRVSPRSWAEFEFQWHTTQARGTCFYVWSMAREAMTKVEPIYQPKDLLWFRETFGYVPTGKGEKIGYKADHDGEMWNKWRPSIHMPKEACRLWAEVTTVSCERVQDITEEQAKAEGSELKRVVYGPHPLKPKSKPRFMRHKLDCTYRKYFEQLWKSIHGPGSWTTNPPVYAINFNPLSKTGRPVEDAKNVSHE